MSFGFLQSRLLTLYGWVWHTSAVALLLIGLVLLVQWIFQKYLTPRWRYALWVLVVVRMLLPAVPASRYSILNLSQPLSLDWLRRSSTALAPPGDQRRSEEPTLPLHSKGEEARFPARALSLPPPLGVSLQAVAPYLWLLGLACYLLKVLAQQYRLSYWLKRQKPVSSDRVIFLMQAAQTTLGLRQRVPVIEMGSLRAPSVFGFLRPHILISRTMLDELSDAELRLVLLHELVHVQRRDVLLNWVLILLQGLHWFNPVVWLALRRLRSDRELVCDAAVMRHLSAEERHDYGTTLIKMLGAFSKVPLVPTLVPILNHKREIHRRIHMIAQFKPTARVVSLLSALLLLALGCLTFTSAAEKTTPPLADKSNHDATLDRQRGLKILEEELARRDAEVKQMQQKVDALKAQFQITDAETVGDGKLAGEPESVRKLTSMRIESKGAFIHADTLFNYLTNLSAVEFKQAILTVVPDAPLVELFNAQARAEQELAKLVETYGSNNPEVKRARVVSELTSRQIEGRLEGIRIGLRAKRDTERARLSELDVELEKARKIDLETSIQRRPYLQARRDLENLQYMRERLALRLLQEKVDAAMPK